MRNYLPDYNVLHCHSLEEALLALRQTPAPIPIAGGTDLMVHLNYRKLPKGTYLNLYSIPELKNEIHIDSDKVVLSALTTYMDVRLNPFFREKMKMLHSAACVVGAVGIQTLGTWAGNIMNASPAADGVPALMAYDARITLASGTGTREILLSDFYSGYKKMDRRPEEIITQITIPLPSKPGLEYYRKVGERKAQAISKVLLAGRLERNDEGIVQKARIVYASVMPHTWRSRSAESLLEGKKLTQEVIEEAISSIGKELKPIDDIRSTARYRLRVAQNLLKEFLTLSLAGKVK